MLNIGNFIFKLNKTTSTKKYYRGVDPHCTVTVHTDVDDVMLNINGDHCHSCEPEEIQIRKFKQAVKARTVNETTPIPQIYDEEATRIDLSTLPIASLTSQREGPYTTQCIQCKKQLNIVYSHRSKTIMSLTKLYKGPIGACKCKDCNIEIFPSFYIQNNKKTITVGIYQQRKVSLSKWKSNIRSGPID
ncbi:unnamed protein product [Rotaria magnacalcarata]|uniref:Uncharacterized protein n=1 Tax=Rotaria magnacalcarata TaxID=392030 RepID=A0A819UFG6_9BILA|nr:unnamed protein product [Rotaria magnacalcarata]